MRHTSDEVLSIVLQILVCPDIHPTRLGVKLLACNVPDRNDEHDLLEIVQLVLNPGPALLHHVVFNFLDLTFHDVRDVVVSWT